MMSIAREGADADAFANIAESLNSNKYIREDEKYSPSRLKPDALEGFYNTILQSTKEEYASTDGETKVQATVNGSNPKKRKLSPNTIPEHVEQPTEEQLVATLVDKLYAEYKAQTVQQIRQDEEDYQRIQAEIAELEKELANESQVDRDPPAEDVTSLEAKARGTASSERSINGEAKVQFDKGTTPFLTDQQPSKQSSTTPVPDPTGQSPPPFQTLPESTVPQPQPVPGRSPIPHAQGHGTPTPRQYSPAPNINGQRPPSLPPQASQNLRASPALSPLNRTLPPPTSYSQHQAYAPGPGQPHMPGSMSPHSPRTLPPPVGMTSGGHSRTPSGSGLPPHGAFPHQQHAQQYPPYPPYGYPPHQWAHPNQQYSQHGPPFADYNSRPSSGGQMYPLQTPLQPQYPYYLQSAPPNRQPGGSMQQSPLPSQPTFKHPASAISTPINSRSGLHRPLRPIGTSTPWTPKTDPAEKLRHGSPERPDRDVSPLSDREASPVSLPGAQSLASSRLQPPKQARKGPSPQPALAKAENKAKVRSGRTNRRTRGGSTSSAIGSESRSQSLASFASETRDRHTSRKVKAEPPSTPAPLPSDTEFPTSAPHRGRGNTVTMPSINAKRKRMPTHEPSPSPSLPTPRPARYNLRSEPQDPTKVSVSKNFQRVANPIINDIMNHKNAGLFAKPLSNRDAPGYNDLIYRPQALSMIKTAVSRGSRAANTAIDELQAGQDEETGTPSKAGPILLDKAEDLVPPKGIVNSSQLEMEAMRIFANAIMFNPLPAGERGFGPAFRMVRVDGKTSAGQTPGSVEDEGAKGYSYVDVAEGGIIEETREMFEDAERKVGEWRVAEMGQVPESEGLKSVIGLRGGSGELSMSEAPDEVQESVTPEVEAARADQSAAGARSGGRKRRKIE